MRDEANKRTAMWTAATTIVEIVSELFPCTVIANWQRTPHTHRPAHILASKSKIIMAKYFLIAFVVVAVSFWFYHLLDVNYERNVIYHCAVLHWCTFVCAAHINISITHSTYTMNDATFFSPAISKLLHKNTFRIREFRTPLSKWCIYEIMFALICYCLADCWACKQLIDSFHT